MSRLRRNFAFCSSKYSVKLSEIGAVYCDALIPNFTLPASGRRHNVAKSPGSRASGAGWAIPFARLRSAGPGGSGLALFERSEFSETPPGASTARQPEGPTQQGRPACTACLACLATPRVKVMPRLAYALSFPDDPSNFAPLPCEARH